MTGRDVRAWLKRPDGLARLVGLRARHRDRIAWEAQRRLNRGKVDEAERLYRALLDLWPGDLPTRLGIAACRQMIRGDLAGAEDAYSALLAEVPDSPHLRLDRAEVRLLAGKTEGARSDLDHAQGLREGVLRRAGLARRLRDLREIAARDSP